MKQKLRNIFSAIVLIAFIFTTNSHADLFEQYMESDFTKARSEISYGFGVNMPPLHRGGGDVLDLHVGTDKGGVCGEFDLTGELKAIFSKEVLDEYVSGLTSSIVSGAPLLLLCYSSQTLCDLYKHFRNMANFAANLRSVQCHEIESLAMDTGTALRGDAVRKCIQKKIHNGETLDTAISSCTKGDIKLEIPGVGELREKYNLAESISKKVSNDPATASLVEGFLGTVVFDVNTGIYKSRFPKDAEQQIVSEFTQRYYEALRDITEPVVSGGPYPSEQELKIVSTPGFPMTPQIIAKLKYVDPVTRDNFYSSYATVAAMTVLLQKISELVDLLELEKGSVKDEVRKEEIERNIKKLDRKYDLMAKQLELQQRYLSPMMVSLMGYEIPDMTPELSSEERKSLMPRSILKSR
ncbi:MAG: hypothetical protein IBX72_15855 [Nitrospirae bacterium]|nr:hypothetical protein [Nitrospirota bacterium]